MKSNHEIGDVIIQNYAPRVRFNGISDVCTGRHRASSGLDFILASPKLDSDSDRELLTMDRMRRLVKGTDNEI